MDHLSISSIYMQVKHLGLVVDLHASSAGISQRHEIAMVASMHMGLPDYLSELIKVQCIRGSI